MQTTSINNSSYKLIATTNSGNDEILEAKNINQQIEKITYIDPYKLFKPIHCKSVQYSPDYFFYFLSQAILLEGLSKLELETKHSISFLILHAFSKVAPLDRIISQVFEFQISPFFKNDLLYTRMNTRERSPFDFASKALTNELSVNGRAYFIDSLSYRKFLKITSENFTKIKNFDEIDDLKRRGVSGDIVDISKLIFSPNDRDTIDLIKCKAVGLKFKSIIAFSKYDGFDILIELTESFRAVRSMAHAGFAPTPEGLKKAWLRVQNLEEILKTGGVEIAKFAKDPCPMPIFMQNFSDLFKANFYKKFSQLSLESEEPYLRIMPKATCDLLEGLKNFDIDQLFLSKGLGDILQFIYYGIYLAMNTALHQKSDITAFYNQLEAIHLAIQIILEIVKPYDELAFERTFKNTYSNFLPKNLEDCLSVYTKTCGMRCLSDILTGIEAQKQGQWIQVVIQKGCYFESERLIDLLEVKSISHLDGEVFDKSPLDSISYFGATDLFLCEFRHNVTQELRIYQEEKVKEQILFFLKINNGHPLTVALDITLNSEEAELSDLLDDPIIQESILKGSLNIQFFKSAQKYFMLGFDNYSGGISISINSPAYFKKFNSILANSKNQLKGLNYQGLTHLLTCAKDSIQLYTKASIENTKILFQKLPPNLIYDKKFAQRNITTISQNIGDGGFFIDLRCNVTFEIRKHFKRYFKYFCVDKNLSISSRESFGFLHTNLMDVGNDRVRISIGLEGINSIENYAKFFHIFSKALNYKTKKYQNPLNSEFVIEYLNLCRSNGWKEL